MENKLPTFKAGDKVWFIRTGKWHTLKETESPVYPLSLKTDVELVSFTTDGRYYSGDTLPSIFHTEQKLDFSEPKFVPEPGQWCWFWDETTKEWPRLSRFCGMHDKKGELYFGETRTKYAAKNGSWFSFCAPFTGELPPHLENL